METVDSYKDLGVMVDPSLKFHKHVRVVVGRAGSMIGELLRGTVCRAPSFMVCIFTTHVRPLIEYCSSVWFTGYLGDLRLLEPLQRRWTREVDGLRHLDYISRLKTLGLYSIYGRLMRKDLIKMFKVICLGEPGPLRSMFVLSHNTRSRGHRFKIVLPRSRTDVLRRNFSVRFVNVWNRLSHTTMNCTNVERFKFFLDANLGELLFSVV